MIVCHRINLEIRCRERGYSLEEVMPCVAEQEGCYWTIDIDHAAYPRDPRPGFEVLTLPVAQQNAPGRGPGTELKKLLAVFGIHAIEGCSCDAIARQMDLWGPDECEKPEHIEWVLAGMRDNAASRGLLFVDAAARLLIRRAIHNARRANASRSPLHPER